MGPSPSRSIMGPPFLKTRNQGEREVHASSRPDVRGLYLSVKCQLEETEVLESRSGCFSTSYVFFSPYV